MIPVKSLQEPSEELLTRECNSKVVASLKQEMFDNPAFADVTPILCIARVHQGESFHSNLKEAYLYETIGGNHSRAGLEEILKENQDMCTDRQYSHRLCGLLLSTITLLLLLLMR